MDQDISPTKKIVSICETQPLTVHGLQHLLESTEDLAFGSAHASPPSGCLAPVPIEPMCSLLTRV